MKSFNNRLIVQAYKKEAIRTTERNGFAFIEQKLGLKGLEILVDTQLADGTYINKGSIAYIKEELLHTAPWAQKTLECAAIGQPFLIVDLTYVEMVGSGK